MEILRSWKMVNLKCAWKTQSVLSTNSRESWHISFVNDNSSFSFRSCFVFYFFFFWGGAVLWPGPVPLFKIVFALSSFFLVHLCMHSMWINIYVWFKQWLRTKRSPDRVILSGPLSVSEFKGAAESIIQIVQKNCFREEWKCLTNGNSVKKSSKLASLDPILEHSLLKTGSRMRFSQIAGLSNSTLMPTDHHVTRLIISHYHRMDGHARVNQTLAAIRKQFWILQGKSAASRVLRQCFQCKQYKTCPEHQWWHLFCRSNSHQTDRHLLMWALTILGHYLWKSTAPMARNSDASLPVSQHMQCTLR